MSLKHYLIETEPTLEQKKRMLKNIAERLDSKFLEAVAAHERFREWKVEEQPVAAECDTVEAMERAQREAWEARQRAKCERNAPPAPLVFGSGVSVDDMQRQRKQAELARANRAITTKTSSSR